VIAVEDLIEIGQRRAAESKLGPRPGVKPLVELDRRAVVEVEPFEDGGDKDGQFFGIVTLAGRGKARNGGRKRRGGSRIPQG